MLDNVFDEGISECLMASLVVVLSGGVHLKLDDVQAASDCIATKAESLGMEEDYYSPFAKSAEAHGMRWLGGKQDDISVIVATVEKQTDNIEQRISSNEMDSPLPKPRK